MIKTVNLPPFKHMCVTIGNLPSSFMESMSYYEALCWMYNYLDKTVIPAINIEGEAITELQNAFTTLKTYVDTYFDNLDVQEEINNKLDDMAESGELTDIIAQYLGLAGVLSFNSVADMKSAENLVNGSTAHTLGYYAVNDGGEAFYKVRTITNEDTVDEGKIIALTDNTLIAELIDNSIINIKQFGAVGDGTTDDTAKIQNAIDHLTSGDTLYIPKGNYKLSKTSSYVTTDYGSYTANYSLIFDSISNIKVKCNGTLLPDLSIENFNVIGIKECSFIEISGVKGNYSGDPNSDTSVLHNKFLFHFYKSNNCLVKECYSYNIGGNTCFTCCNNCSNDNSLCDRASDDYKAPALYGAYKSHNIIFNKCVGYGSCNDGDISIFGSCTDCKVSNCEIYCYSMSDTTKTIVKNNLQGICVDSGCLNCTVINNIVYGYYYGIDVKSNCENIDVIGNQCIKNKIGVAVRLGENPAPTYNTNVVDNIISVDDGNGNTVDLYGDIKLAGIFIEDAIGLTINNNTIGSNTSATGYTNTWTGIYGLCNREIAENVLKTNSIIDNSILLENRKGNNYSYSNGSAIYLTGTSEYKISNYIIKNNYIKARFAQSLTYYDIYVNYGNNIKINGNTFNRKPNSIGFINTNYTDNLFIENNIFASSNRAFMITDGSNISIKNNKITSSGNSNNAGNITSCNNVIITDNYYYASSSTNESNILVIASVTNGILKDNVAYTSKSSFFAVPGGYTNTNVSETGTTLWSNA